MARENLVISTITLARSKAEGNLILNSLEMLIDKGIAPIIAVDGGSDREFVEKIESLKGVSIITDKKDGLQGQIKKSLLEAKKTGYRYIFYTEPNKYDFFASQTEIFVDKTMELADNDVNFGIALPSRNQKSYTTFPPFQQYTETVTNNLISSFNGKTYGKDYAYGPRIIESSLVSYLNKIEDDLVWGWMSFLVIIAHRLGKTLHTISLDLPCPENERIETENDKVYRLKQLGDHIKAIYQATKVPLS